MNGGDPIYEDIGPTLKYLLLSRRYREQLTRSQARHRFVSAFFILGQLIRDDGLNRTAFGFFFQRRRRGGSITSTCCAAVVRIEAAAFGRHDARLRLRELGIGHRGLLRLRLLLRMRSGLQNRQIVRFEFFQALGADVTAKHAGLHFPFPHGIAPRIAADTPRLFGLLARNVRGGSGFLVLRIAHLVSQISLTTGRRVALHLQSPSLVNLRFLILCLKDSSRNLHVFLPLTY